MQNAIPVIEISPKLWSANGHLAIRAVGENPGPFTTVLLRIRLATILLLCFVLEIGVNVTQLWAVRKYGNQLGATVWGSSSNFQPFHRLRSNFLTNYSFLLEFLCVYGQQWVWTPLQECGVLRTPGRLSTDGPVKVSAERQNLFAGRWRVGLLRAHRRWSRML